MRQENERLRMERDNCNSVGGNHSGLPVRYDTQPQRREIGPELFRAACRMGLEGLVSKHRERRYEAGRCKHWIKVKNRQHPAYSRVQDQF